MVFFLVLFYHATAIALTGAKNQKHLTAADFRNAQRLPERSQAADRIYKKPAHPLLEDPELFEGDIKLAEGHEKPWYVNQPIQTNTEDANHENNDALHNGIRNQVYRWRDLKIPYELSGAFTQFERSRIAKAMTKYHQNTCLRFEPRQQSDGDYLQFIKGQGCWSYVGRQGGQQQISIGTGCVQAGIIEHEMMHAIGFYHEQSRTDREEYITVVYDNIIGGMERNFATYSQREIDHFGTAYDYGSIMHYGSTAFSKNGQATIIAPQPIGQRTGLSSNDILKINRMYCADLVTTSSKVPTTTSKLPTTTTSNEPTTTSNEPTTTPKAPTTWSKTTKNLEETTTADYVEVTTPSSTCEDDSKMCYYLVNMCGYDFIQGICCRTCREGYYSFGPPPTSSS